jgi:hypothetical protein
MNRYIGKTCLIPTATIFSVMAIGFALSWEMAEWIIQLSGVAMLALAVPIFMAVPKILGTNFEKKPETAEKILP